MKKICLAVAATLALSACTTNPYTGERETSKAAIGGGLGALAGAVIGGASASSGDREKGILIGAASGAALGGGVGYYMDVQEAKLRDQMRGTGVSVSRNGDNIMLNMPSSITFAVDSADLSPSFYNTLSGVAMVLKEYEKTYVNVVGHTDNTGSASHNQALSERRAASVGQFLISQGAAANRFNIRGVGFNQPVASNNTADGRAQNRRVEITLSPMG
ncbi:outer membrane protein OmpA-like peptidoglycan-associated protein [Oceanisphaera litoralis]|uniref:OmpA family lipoprotein n=1 Tax=Oceanisphaera litoralis TaxID=225144 RepID=UPI0019570EA0|nr:OmpA family lipoprotein [Oceanisphaera litoralis]MBM7455982.1 outer membrane protein OmpA-like peptidoglycan-associated protein [Oceanisphaera litoralis]